MKYHVTYRLMHPQSLPALSVAVMEASSHAELDAQVTKIKTKWQAIGYKKLFGTNEGMIAYATTGNQTRVHTAQMDTRGLNRTEFEKTLFPFFVLQPFAVLGTG